VTSSAHDIIGTNTARAPGCQHRGRGCGARWEGMWEKGGNRKWDGRASRPHVFCPPLVICPSAARHLSTFPGFAIVFALELLVCTQSCHHSQHAHAYRLADNSRTHTQSAAHTHTESLTTRSHLLTLIQSNQQAASSKQRAPGEARARHTPARPPRMG
jgi:hypothetical protein